MKNLNWPPVRVDHPLQRTPVQYWAHQFGAKIWSRPHFGMPLQNHNLCEIGILRRWAGHYLALTCAAARRRRRCWGVVAGGAEAVPETWRSRCLATTPSSSGSGLLSSEIFHQIFNMSSRIYKSYSKKESLTHSFTKMNCETLSDVWPSKALYSTWINAHFKTEIILIDYFIEYRLQNWYYFIDLGFYSPKSFVEF